jgi:hypothetical protein
VPWEPTDYQVFGPHGLFTVGMGSIFTTSLPLAVLTLPVVPQGQLWRIESLTVQVNYDTAVVPFPVTVAFYDGLPVSQAVPAAKGVLEPLQGLFQVSTAVGAGLVQAWDSSDDGAPVTVLGGRQPTIVFGGSASMGKSIASARVQVIVMQGVPGRPTPVAGAQPPPTIPAGI